MPVTGLAATLTEDARERDRALDALARDARVTVGPREGGRVALVLATDTADEDRDLLQTLRALPGVALVHVVFHDFSDVERFEGTPPKRWVND